LFIRTLKQNLKIIGLRIKIIKKKDALAGNRTRAARVAGEHSTTEPPVLQEKLSF
jgi:hypothetical protein